MTNSKPESSLLSRQSIAQGASIFLIGKIIANLLRFLFNAVLTRSLGASLYGIYAFADTLVTIFITLSRLGTGKAVLKFVPKFEGDNRRRNWSVGVAYATSFGGSVLIGVALFFAAPIITSYTLENPLLTDVFRILAIVLPFNTATNLTNSVFRALERLEYQVAISDIALPVVQLLVAAGALALGYSVLGVVSAIAIGGVLVFSIAVSLLYTRTSIQPTIYRSRSETLEFYNFSLPLMMKDVGSVLYTRVDILMVGIFLVEADVGIYQIAILISGFLMLPLTAFNQLFPPIASRLYENNQMDDLQSIYQTVTRWAFSLALIPALGVLIYHAELLAIFGSEFTAGGTVLVFFALAQLTNCAVGPSGFLLMMTDHQYLNMANQWILGVSNVVLNYYFILEFGLIGAAMATASVLASINLVRVAEVWYTERLFPYTTNFWKPLAASAVAGTVMYIFEMYLSGYYALAIGGVSGGIVFFSLLFLFGIERDDRELVKELVSNI